MSAPPAFAPTAPSTARKSSEAIETRHQVGEGVHDHHQQRQRRAGSEGCSGGECRLHRPGCCDLGNAKFVTRMRAERVLGHHSRIPDVWDPECCPSRGYLALPNVQ